MPTTKRQQSPLDNPSFRRWFGDSIVVDDNDEPLVVYHGGFDVIKSKTGTFKPSEFGMFGAGIYFTPDKSYAKPFASEVGGVVRPFFLKVENPLIIVRDPATKFADKKDPIVLSLAAIGVPIDQAQREVEQERKRTKQRKVSRVLQKHLEAMGFDGIVAPTWEWSRSTRKSKRLRMDKDVAEIVVFRSEQVKSANFNDGSYDPENADVRRNPSR